ncbi:MAG: hypothetical protein P8M16_00325 [Acidimicrobiales bacterium]|jgi:hypothetical protein|nr:hypothetical protein [Acidimicrobiales bacterium]|tara:strand:+ start:771 stop:1136 length:366 start_codon:yes stop_codon:yes gene_type:complete
MTLLVVLTVVAAALLIAELAIYLFVVGSQLLRVAEQLEGCSSVVWDIRDNAEPIEAGVERINNTGKVIAGALPLLYGMAEGIVVGATFEPSPDAEPVVARPAMKRRRTRLHEAVGYLPAEQ